MTKRKIIILIAVLLCIIPLFAKENDSLTLNFSPYPIQIATSSAEDEDPIRFKSGVGGEAIYKHHTSEHFFVEGGIGLDTFVVADDNPEIFSNLLFFTGLGITQVFTEEFTIDFHCDIAADTLFYDNAISETISIKTGINCAYVIHNRLSATAGCDAVFGFAEKDGTNYVNYRILPVIGIKVSF